MISEINESLGVDRHTCICGVLFCTNMLRPLPKILLVLETTDAPTGRPPSEKPCRASSRAASQPGDCLRDSMVSGDVIFVIHKDVRFGDSSQLLYGSSKGLMEDLVDSTK